MTQLAIKGHATRGKEVIGLLEMLGGKNSDVSGENIHAVYSIPNNGYIYPYLYAHKKYPDDFIIFTLEEFLEKFPYKIGDKVIYEDKRREITKMVWEEQTNTVAYKLDDKLYCNVVNELQPYKEETMEEKKKDYEEWFHTDYLEFENNDDTWADEVEINLGKDYEIQFREDKVFIVKKKPQYPKTYVECAKILNCFGAVHIDGYKCELLEKFQELLIARDAYWKIAGEQMGLDEPWKPDYGNDCDTKYIITVARNEIYKDVSVIFNYFLIFPTEEMQNAFYENFKDLIEECKQFL